MTENLDRDVVALKSSSTDPERKKEILPFVLERLWQNPLPGDNDVVSTITRLACTSLDTTLLDSAFNAVALIVKNRPEMADVVAKVAGDYSLKEIPYQTEAAERILALMPKAGQPERPVDRAVSWLQERYTAEPKTV